MKKTIGKIPIPDFEKRLLSVEEIEELQNKTVLADPITGESTTPVKQTYADIAKRFQVDAPSEVYIPTAADVAKFYSKNPQLHNHNRRLVTDQNGEEHFKEFNPNEKELTELPPVESLFHNLNHSVLREQ